MSVRSIFGAQRQGAWVGQKWDIKTRGADKNTHLDQLALTGDWADKEQHDPQSCQARPTTKEKVICGVRVLAQYSPNA
jgi:hypothetical protein